VLSVVLLHCNVEGDIIMGIPSTGLSRDERSTGGGLKPLTLTVKQACALSGLGATKMWQLMGERRLDVVRLDGRTLITYPSFERLFSPDPTAQPAPRPTPRKRGRPRKVRPADDETGDEGASGG
jgi:hypothetical protein